MDNEHGSWRAVNCNSPQFYVCQRPLDPASATPPPPASVPSAAPAAGGRCPDGWTHYGSDRCLHVSDQLAAWDDARRYCQNEAQDGELVTITDPVQQGESWTPGPAG